MSIYIGNSSYEAGQDDLRQAFSEHEAVKNVQLPTNRETGRMSGFAFTSSESPYA